MIAWSTTYNFKKAASALELLEAMTDGHYEQLIERIKQKSDVYVPTLAQEMGYSVTELEADLQQLAKLGLVCQSSSQTDKYVFNHYRYLRLVILTSQVVGTKASVAR